VLDRAIVATVKNAISKYVCNVILKINESALRENKYVRYLLKGKE